MPGDRAGLRGEHLDMISPHPIGSLTFDGVRVDRTELLGEPDRGFRVAMRTLDLFRPSVGAFAVGMAQAALDAAVRHAGTRMAFGGPLKDQQAISHLLAEMATRTEAARLLVYAAAAAYDAGEARTSVDSGSGRRGAGGSTDGRSGERQADLRGQGSLHRLSSHQRERFAFRSRLERGRRTAAGAA